MCNTNLSYSYVIIENSSSNAVGNFYRPALNVSPATYTERYDAFVSNH